MAFDRKAWMREWRRKNPERVKAHGKKWYDKNGKESLRKRYRMNKAKVLEWGRKYRSKCYGLSADQWKEVDERKRVECCEICGGLPSRTERGTCNKILHIDHNHKTGQFRGLLCHRCNTGLGSFKDNPEFLSAAISYLKERDI